MVRLTGYVLIGVLRCFASLACAAEPAVNASPSEMQLAESMLDCARLTDTAKKLKCFDRVKPNAPGITQPSHPPQRATAPAPRVERAGEPNLASPSAARSPAVADPAPIAFRSKKKDPSEILSDYSMECVRQLGKEMHPEEYPVRARAQGIGGTVRSVMRIGPDGRIADVTVASSSGNHDLDQYVIDKLSRLRLPQVPPEFWAREFTVQIPVTFAVRKN
jgi:periplasmic protein TonB